MTPLLKDRHLTIDMVKIQRRSCEIQGKQHNNSLPKYAELSVLGNACTAPLAYDTLNMLHL